MANQGWECPRCGAVNAPWVAKCDCAVQHAATSVRIIPPPQQPQYTYDPTLCSCINKPENPAPGPWHSVGAGCALWREQPMNTGDVAQPIHDEDVRIANGPPISGGSESVTTAALSMDDVAETETALEPATAEPNRTTSAVSILDRQSRRQAGVFRDSGPVSKKPPVVAMGKTIV